MSAAEAGEPIGLFERDDTLEPRWFDAKGRLRAAHLVEVFDRFSGMVAHVGLTREYRKENRRSTFVVEAHFTVAQPLTARPGERVKITTQLIDHDAKKFHVLHRMSRGEGSAGGKAGESMATYEIVIFHVDMENRRSTEMPDWMQARLAALKADHDRYGRPQEAGRKVGL